MTLSNAPKSWAKADSAADVTVLRKAVHNILYTVANGNGMNAFIVGYAPATWEIVMWVVTGAVAAGVAVWGVFAFRKVNKKKKETA